MSHYRWEGDDLLIACHTQPGARSEGFTGRHGDRLKIRVAAAAVEGQANARLCRWLADVFGVAPRDVTIVRGSGSRQKLVRITQPRQLPPAAEIER